MKKKIAIVTSSAVTALALPFVAFAQAITSAQSLGQYVINLINTVAVPVLFAIAFIVFIWGIFQYFILSKGNEEKQGEARSLMLYGLIGFFLMVSVWGLVNIFVGTFAVNNSPVNFPQAPSH